MTFIYNNATSNLAIYSHETSQNKLSEALNRQSIIVIQMHDKLHEKLLFSQREQILSFKSSFLWYDKSLLPHWMTSLECYFFLLPVYVTA